MKLPSEPIDFCNIVLVSIVP